MIRSTGVRNWFLVSIKGEVRSGHHQPHSLVGASHEGMENTVPLASWLSRGQLKRFSLECVQSAKCGT